MAIWYEVAHTEEGIRNFLECNWEFHDFTIGRFSYDMENKSAELFMRYDENEGSVLLRFLNVEGMRVEAEVDGGYPVNWIMGSVLLLLDNGNFLWIDDDGDKNPDAAAIAELKQCYDWVQAGRILWAVTDAEGNPTEMPPDKINQVGHVYGKVVHRHYDLTPYEG